MVLEHKVRLAYHSWAAWTWSAGWNSRRPQLGVRHSRRLVGVKKVLRAQWPSGDAFDDEIGVSPSLSPKFPNISIPYGSLVPQQLDGLLARDPAVLGHRPGGRDGCGPGRACRDCTPSTRCR